MIVNRIDASPKAKLGRPFGMSPGLRRGHNYGSRVETFPVPRPSFWHRVERYPAYGPREERPDFVDLTCLTCGRTVPGLTTHGEDWRDAAHPVRAYSERSDR